MAKAEISAVAAGLGISALTQAVSVLPRPPQLVSQQHPEPPAWCGGEQPARAGSAGAAGASPPTRLPVCCLHPAWAIEAATASIAPPEGRGEGSSETSLGKHPAQGPAVQAVAVSQAVTPAGGQARSRPGRGGWRDGAGG